MGGERSPAASQGCAWASWRSAVVPAVGRAVAGRSGDTSQMRLTLLRLVLLRLLPGRLLPILTVIEVLRLVQRLRRRRDRVGWTTWPAVHRPAMATVLEDEYRFIPGVIAAGLVADLAARAWPAGRSRIGDGTDGRNGLRDRSATLDSGWSRHGDPHTAPRYGPPCPRHRSGVHISDTIPAMYLGGRVPGARPAALRGRPQTATRCPTGRPHASEPWHDSPAHVAGPGSELELGDGALGEDAPDRERGRRGR